MLLRTAVSGTDYKRSILLELLHSKKDLTGKINKIIGITFFSMFSNLHKLLWWWKLFSDNLTVTCIGNLMSKTWYGSIMLQKKINFVLFKEIEFSGLYEAVILLHSIYPKFSWYFLIEFTADILISIFLKAVWEWSCSESFQGVM